MASEIRLILTDNCNYNCWFCHKEGMENEPSNDELNLESLKFLLAEYKSWSHNDEITLTGGEPLEYERLGSLIDFLYSIGYKITITTNGFNLPIIFKYINKIKKLNISFHANNEEIYERIVAKKGTFLTVKKNLYALRKINNIIEVSLNVTIINSLNSGFENIEKIINFAHEINVNIKLIEFFPSYSEHNYPLNNYVEFLKIKQFKLVKHAPRKSKYSDGKITITLSKIFCEDAINNDNADEYCNKYNDLFLSHHGYFKLCRYSNEKIDIKEEVESKKISELHKKFKLININLGHECSKTCYNSRKNEIIESTKEFIKMVFNSESSGHDYYHSIRVLNNAIDIYNHCESNADLFIMQMIALLHDVEDYKLINLEETGRVCGFLTSQRIPYSDRKIIQNGIKQVSFNYRLFSDDVYSDEVKIVQDADVLDAIGAIGIARTFAYGGKVKRPIYDPDVQPQQFFASKKEYQSNKGTSINHFYEKILKLPNMMNTSYGKKMAELRKSFVQNFLKEFMEEWQGINRNDYAHIENN